MILAAATATAEADHTRAYLILALIALAACAGYAVACWIWPFTACRKCDGRGRFRSPTGKNWRPCPRCKGTGSRIRLGRRMFNYLSLTSKEAKL